MRDLSAKCRVIIVGFTFQKHNDEIHGMRANKDKDPLAMKEAPMTRSHATKAKEAM